MTIRKTRHTSGIELEPSDTTTDTLNREGQIAVDSTDKEVKVYLDSAQRTVVTEDQVQVLTNKTIDADDNTISDLEVDNLKTGVLNTSTTLSGATDSQVPSALAVKTYIESSSGSVQSDVDDLVSLSGVAANSTDLGTFTGSVIPDSSDVKEALQALETSVETKGDVYGPATSTDNALARFDLATGKLLQNSVVTVSDTGVVAGSSIDADTNTITNIENADIKAAAAIDRSKLASGTNNAVVHNDGSGVMINSSDLLVATNALTLANTKHLEIQASTDATTTGANATLSAFTSGAVRLTNGSLTSVETIPAGSNGQELTLFNRTGVDFTIPTSGNILSGTNAQITVKNNSALQLSYDSTSTKWQIIGGTGSGEGSSGIINYITDPSCELAVTSWSTYADAAGTSPVDGTGGSPSVTVSNSITSPLRGLRSLVMVKDAANRQGNGISIPFTIDNSDKGKVLQGSFEYQIASGTFADNDLSVWIYDVTNARMIQPAPYLVKNSGIIEKMPFEFQTSIDSNSYRLIVHVASTSALAYTVKFDNVIVGPQAKLYGSPLTDLRAYIPSGTWVTNTTYIGFYSRIGDRLHVNAKVSLSGAPTGNFTLNIPSGLSIDTAKLSTLNRQSVGTALGDRGATSYTGEVFQNDATSVSIVSSGAASRWNATTPATWASSDVISVDFTVPIAGWSSSQVMSSDADTRVVAFSAQGATTSLPTSTVTTVNFSSQVDSHSCWNGTNTYTVKVPGYYRISPSVTFINSTNATYYTDIRINKNGSAAASYTYYYSYSPSAQSITLAFDKILLLSAGDQISIAVFQGSGVTGSVTAGSITNLSIERLSGPAQIAASESVNSRFTTAAGQSIANGSTVIVDFGTKDYDSHGSVTTGASWKFTAPSNGKYNIDARVLFSNASSFTAGNALNISIFKNGSEVTTDITRIGVTGLYAYSIVVRDDISLLSGDYIDIRVSHGEASARTFLASAIYNKVSIKRVGN